MRLIYLRTNSAILEGKETTEGADKCRRNLWAPGKQHGGVGHLPPGANVKRIDNPHMVVCCPEQTLPCILYSLNSTGGCHMNWADVSGRRECGDGHQKPWRPTISIRQCARTNASGCQYLPRLDVTKLLPGAVLTIGLLAEDVTRAQSGRS